MNEMPYRRPEGDPRADEIARLVREIAANRRALLPRRPFVRDLDRIIKDPWKDGPVDVLNGPVVAAMPMAAKVSVRLDTTLEREGELAASGRLVRVNPGLLELRRGRATLAVVRGPAPRLDLLAEFRATEAIGAMLLPRDLEELATRRVALANDVKKLLSDGRELVEQVERIVCALYGLSNELTNRVVAHAIRRAGTSATHEPSDED
jgi:hypothetical protein